MKIKGIDLYKRVLEEDETILGKVFEFDDMKIKVVATFGNLSNEWGLTKYDSQYSSHIFSGIRRKQLDEILKAEWTEVKEHVDFMTAFRAWTDEGKDVTCVYGERETKQIFRGANPSGTIGVGLIERGKWYIED